MMMMMMMLMLGQEAAAAADDDDDDVDVRAGSCWCCVPRVVRTCSVRCRC